VQDPSPTAPRDRPTLHRHQRVDALERSRGERLLVPDLDDIHRQAAELGAQVRRGEHGSLVAYSNRITRTEKDDAGEEHEREIPFLNGYTIFNCEQIDGLPEHFYRRRPTSLYPMARIQQAEDFVRATQAEIRHGGNAAYYAWRGTMFICPSLKRSTISKDFTRPFCMN
jgi:hypothetical protein